MDKSSRNSKNEVILLTGCINPGGMSFTSLQDPEIRKGQYIDAIKFYLNTTILPIVFVENSGTDLSTEFQNEINSQRLEIITFCGNNHNRELGKGYGEMVIVEKALEASSFLNESSFIFKITGRYKLLNFKSLLKEYQKQGNLELFVDLKHQNRYSDSRFWGCTPRFLREIFFKYKDEINDSKKYYFEHALCFATHEAISKKYAYSGLKYSPRFKGISGTDNKKVRHSLLYWLPLNIKNIIKYNLYFKNR